MLHVSLIWWRNVCTSKFTACSLILKIRWSRAGVLIAELFCSIFLVAGTVHFVSWERIYITHAAADRHLQGWLNSSLIAIKGRWPCVFARLCCLCEFGGNCFISKWAEQILYQVPKQSVWTLPDFKGRQDAKISHADFEILAWIFQKTPPITVSIVLGLLTIMLPIIGDMPFWTAFTV